MAEKKIESVDSRTSVAVYETIEADNLTGTAILNKRIRKEAQLEFPEEAGKEITLLERPSVKARFVEYWKHELKRSNIYFFFIGFQLSVFGLFQILNGKESIFTFDTFALVIVAMIVLGSFVVYALKLYPYRSPVSIMIEMTPFLFAYYSYSLIANLAKNVIYPNVNESFLYNADMTLFGWIFGELPNRWFAEHLKSPAVDIIAAIIYTIDMSVPILVCVYLFLARKKASFEAGTLAILLMGIMAQITFVLFPTAPPWYVTHFGFKNPTYGRDYSIYAGAGLSSFDEITGFPLISKFYSASSSYFAAFPSMHAGFTFITVFIAYQGLGKKSLFFTIPFTLIVCLIALYSYHHYIVDLLAGMLYATVAYFIVRLLMKLFKRKEILTELGYKYE